MKQILSALFLSFVAVIYTPLSADAQSPDGKDSIQRKTAVAGARYNKARRVKRILLGEHYRKDWAAEVDVEVLDLAREKGGLTPTRMGGGKQTKSLRLIAGDGKQYVLRSVEKDPSKAIPKELTGTIADDIVQDQISSSNPYAAIAVAALAETAGLYHTNPRIVFVPDVPQLDTFRKDFANTLCLFEERPTGNQEDMPNFGNSKDIDNSETMYENLKEDVDDQVDQKAFVKARLFDLLIGDWDRHEDQWVWAAFKDGKKTIYRPIGRDRDQAFSRLDGFIPYWSTRRWALRQTKHFDHTINDVVGLAMTGVFLDRRFTNELTLNDWLDAAKTLQEKLTDEKIEAALKTIPASIYQLSGRDIEEKLKSRRDQLHKYAAEYFHFLTNNIDVIGSDKREFFKVERLNAGSTLVSMYKMNKNREVTDLVYRRTLYPGQTKELRLYGLAGEDSFHISGAAKKGILVRVLGGNDKDAIIDSSSVKGLKRKTVVYDTPGNEFVFSKETKQKISYDSIQNAYDPKGFRHDWLAPKLAPGYNPDDGIYVGGGIVFKKHKFQKAPFGYMHAVWANYAFATGAYNFWYEGIFPDLMSKWGLALNAKVNAPNYVLNYYGSGNETERTADKRFYRVRTNQIEIKPSLFRQLSKNHLVSAGVFFQSNRVDSLRNTFITEIAKTTSEDFRRHYFGGVELGYRLDNTDNILYPLKGFRANVVASLFRDLKNGVDNFSTISGDVSGYTSFGALTAAVRVGAATNIGEDFKFYQYNTLGGTTNLRGYYRTRFSGKTSFYNNVELRWKIINLNGYVFRGAVGAFGFADHGRVWVPDDDSDKWHGGYGAGLFYLPYNRIAFTVTYGISEESNLLNVRAGFLF